MLKMSILINAGSVIVHHALKRAKVTTFARMEIGNTDTSLVLLRLGMKRGVKNHYSV